MRSYTLYHTYELDYLGSGRWRRWRRISVPGWAVVIALVSLCLPPVAVSLSIVSWIIYMLKFLKERYPNSKFIIIVCHAVNDKGLVNMCNNFDQVIVSNSHRDINYRPSNENLTDVCK